MVFEEIKKSFGFGCMRLPLNRDETIDLIEFSKMVDAFMKQGFTYFDTAHVYLKGLSELALRDCLVKRYDRSLFTITNKLTGSCFDKEEDILPFFQNQLKCCGVDYFDFYLMHAQNRNNYEHFKACNAYAIASKLKEQGFIHHLGISFHDTHDVLEQMLIEHPEIEVVQLQFNYLDYESPVVESRLNYEVCVKYHKPVIVMEPVKGGSLVNLTKEALSVLQTLGNGSPASFALRFARSFDNCCMVLSGMSDLIQMEDNLLSMNDFKRLNENDFYVLEQVRDIILKEQLIGCTSCKYCVDGCPMHIQIPYLFSLVNQHDNNINDYNSLTKSPYALASSCICCGKCEKICPQHLKIRDLLKYVVKIYE